MMAGILNGNELLFSFSLVDASEVEVELPPPPPVVAVVVVVLLGEAVGVGASTLTSNVKSG
jgi:hypothetical protein